MGPPSRAGEPSLVRERLAGLVDQGLLLAGPGDAAANWVATRQHSVISRGQATAAGLGKKAIHGRCARGSWIRLYPSVFAVGAQPLSQHGRVLAATLDAGAFAVATGPAATFLYGMAKRPGDVIHLAMVGRHNAAARPGVMLHRPRGLGWNDVRFVAGIPVTSPVETLVTLAEELRGDELEAMCALAIRRRLVSWAALRHVATNGPGRPGLPALRRATRAPALTRSGNERLMLALVRRAELPEPETNIVVADKELDLYWPDAKLGVEVDAFSTHGSIASFEDDRKVDADLEAADVRVVRFTGGRIRERPEAVVARLAAILALRLGGLPPRRRRP
jgi:very-short-patch-repair endonuclease